MLEKTELFYCMFVENNIKQLSYGEAIKKHTVKNLGKLI